MDNVKRIAEILKAYTKKHNISASSVILEEYAEELVANGVIVPPCKVGYYIWFLQNDRLVLGLVQNITVSQNGLFAYVFEIDEHNEIENEWSIPLCDFGKTVFLTKEEAEAKLKESEVQGE